MTYSQRKKLSAALQEIIEALHPSRAIPKQRTHTMGANTSALLSEEIDEISREENLSQSQVKRLYNRFQKLDSNQIGTLDAGVLLMIPELAMNPLHPRLISIFQNNNFRQFVSNVSAFNRQAEPERKADFAFKVYDVDGDGYITKTDLREILIMLVGDNIQDNVLDNIIDKILNHNKSGGDGRISRNDFTLALDLPAIASKLTVAL